MGVWYMESLCTLSSDSVNVKVFSKLKFIKKKKEEEKKKRRRKRKTYKLTCENVSSKTRRTHEHHE